MKRMIAGLFIALVTIVGIPNFGMANTNSATASTVESTSEGYASYRLLGNYYQTHSVYLRPGQARITISGDGDTDLDLYVYDSSGLIARSESSGDFERVDLSVYRGGYFTVKVVNRGNVYNDYTLFVE